LIVGSNPATPAKIKNMSKKTWKLLKKKSEKERERDKIIFNMFNYGCAAGFLSAGFIVGIIMMFSEKLKDAEELKVNWGKLKEFIQPFSWILLAVLLVFRYCTLIIFTNIKRFPKN
jgi:hypothetical protein